MNIRNILKEIFLFYEPQASSSAVNFDNVMTRFLLNKRTDAQKTDANLFFTITGPKRGQMLGINEGKTCRKLALNKAK